MRLRSVLLVIATVLAAAQVVMADEGQIHLTLSGDWSGVEERGTEVSFSFTKEGTVVWRVKEEEFMRDFPEGLKAKYQIRAGKPLCEFDIYDLNDPRLKEIRFRGILEITDGQTFKMEGKWSNKGERPTEFSDDAIVLRASKK